MKKKKIERKETNQLFCKSQLLLKNHMSLSFNTINTSACTRRFAINIDEADEKKTPPLKLNPFT